MHPSSYTIEIHVSHTEIERALAEAGSQASVADVVRALAEVETPPCGEAISQAITQLGDLKPLPKQADPPERYEPGDELGLGVGAGEPWSVASELPEGKAVS